MVRRYISVVSMRSLTRPSSPMAPSGRTNRSGVWQAQGMQATQQPLSVPHRFHGPPSSGNGGWTAGALAERLTVDDRGTAITVALRLPPPLDVPLEVITTDAGVAALHDGRPVAEARPAPAALVT